MIGRFASSRSTPLFVTFTISLIITCICTTYKVTSASYANIVIKLHDATIFTVHYTVHLLKIWGEHGGRCPSYFSGKKILLPFIPYPLTTYIQSFEPLDAQHSIQGVKRVLGYLGRQLFPLAPHPCFNFYWGAKYLIWGPRKKIEVNHLTRYIFAPHQKRFEVGQHLWR